MANKTSKNQVVYPHENGWAVRKEGSDRATAVYDTREEAMERANKIIDKYGGELYYYYTGEEETTNA